MSHSIIIIACLYTNQNINVFVSCVSIRPLFHALTFRCYRMLAHRSMRRIKIILLLEARSQNAVMGRLSEDSR